MSLKTILGWTAVAFVVFYVVAEPNEAGHVVHNIETFLATAASGFSHFVSSI
jgi:hypothetical protein